MAAGACLLVGGGVLAWWAFQHFDSLPNYLRLGAVVPLLVSYPMLSIRAYINWHVLDMRHKGHAAGALIAPILVALGALMWYIESPGTYG